MKAMLSLSSECGPTSPNRRLLTIQVSLSHLYRWYRTPWSCWLLWVVCILLMLLFYCVYACSEQPIFTTRVHVFQIDPDTKKKWLPVSSQPVAVSFYHDTARGSYRIISLDGSKVRSCLVTCSLTPLPYLTLPYLRGGQVITPAQRWGRISYFSRWHVARQAWSSGYNFFLGGGDCPPYNLGGQKPSQNWCDFAQLRTSITNISKTDEDIDKRKSSWSTTIPPTFAEKILVKFGPRTKKVQWCMLTHPRSNYSFLLSKGKNYWKEENCNHKGKGVDQAWRSNMSAIGLNIAE